MRFSNIIMDHMNQTKIDIIIISCSLDVLLPIEWITEICAPKVLIRNSRNTEKKNSKILNFFFFFLLFLVKYYSSMYLWNVVKFNNNHMNITNLINRRDWTWDQNKQKHWAEPCRSYVLNISLQKLHLFII